MEPSHELGGAANLAAMRRDYAGRELLESEASGDPFEQFARWFDDAVAARVAEPNSMTLATASREGRPSARVVLCKRFDHRGAVFYTNYGSHKARDIETNPQAALVFFWELLARQVRIEGAVVRLSDHESDEYFASRPYPAQLGAWASDQSRPVPDRATIHECEKAMKAHFEGREVPRPPHWGGYRVVPEVIEFWQGQPSRLHDRLVYVRRGDVWERERLFP